MAIKSVLDFSIYLLGDGVDLAYSVSTGTGPFGLRAPDTIHGPSQIAPALSLAALTPDGVFGVVSANGHSISASIAGGMLTITYANGDGLTSGELDSVAGYLTFPG